ncbi:hypothetical protein D9756_001861 [Leucocoprinus leucothites]|uniref:NYN domain-containing protein n=1 Tax=Leucocoprinus leucothites TaxID=201217 RepID=A0A8H5G3Z3_9AGAR|nr:hypothetical protein D9756_001861 [Leucoagaricus leucothites]
MILATDAEYGVGREWMVGIRVYKQQFTFLVYIKGKANTRVVNQHLLCSRPHDRDERRPAAQALVNQRRNARKSLQCTVIQTPYLLLVVELLVVSAFVSHTQRHHLALIRCGSFGNVLALYPILDQVDKMPQPKIKVFWDLESCPPPHAYDGSPWDLVKAIRLFTLRFGVVTSFKAYWDLSRPSTTNTEALKAVMPSMGINFVDCSLVKEYDRDALSRTLSAEVLLSAIDDPSDHGPGGNIIMIFSGDRGILHPISLLMLRGCAIYLVVPGQFDRLELSRATQVFDWTTDVLDLKLNTSPASVSVLNAGQSGSSGSNATGPIANKMRHSLDVSRSETPLVSPPKPAVSEVGFFHSKPPPRSPQAATQPQLPPYTSFTNVASLLSPRTPLTNVAPLHSMSATAGTPARADTKPIIVPSPSDFSSGSRTPSVLSRRSSNQTSTFGSTLSRQTRVDLTYSPEKHPGSPGLPRPEPRRQIEVAPTDNWGTNGGWNEGGGWEINSSDWSVKPEKEPEGFQAEAVHRTGLAIGHLVPEPLPGMRDLPSHVALQPEASTADNDNSAFLPLLQCLQKAKAEGKVQVLRSVLGMELSKNKNIYYAAGVTTFSGYVALAAQRGLVTLGVVGGGKDWISLS